jgi:outer membrane immunogenic protein
MQLRDSIKRTGIVVGVALLLSMAAAVAQQEDRSEISVLGTGFFTKDTGGNGIEQHATETGGFLLGYRYNINRWLSAEANYGYDRNTQIYFGGAASRVQSNIHQITGSAVVKLPSLARLQPYALAGGGGLVFDPTGNAGGSFAGATRVTQGAFVYGVGGDYAFTRHFSLRAEYRGYVYKAPDFDLTGLNTNTWTHTAVPSAGIVFRF